MLDEMAISMQVAAIFQSHGLVLGVGPLSIAFLDVHGVVQRRNGLLTGEKPAIRFVDSLICRLWPSVPANVPNFYHVREHKMLRCSYPLTTPRYRDR